MRWKEFLLNREARAAVGRAWAQGSAAGLPWRFASQPKVARVVWARVADSPSRPAPCEYAAVLGPPPANAPSEEAAEQAYRRFCAERAVGMPVESPQAWAVAELAWVGQEIEARERAAWRRATLRPDPPADLAAADLWRGWFGGDPWTGRARWTRRYLPTAVRVFRSVLESRRVPPGIRDRTLADLREAFFDALLGGAQELPGWAELAGRVAETADPGPIDALAALFGPESRRKIALCAATRGQFGETLAALLPGDRLARAAALERWISVDPGALEVFADAHVALRLIALWADGEATSPTGSWDIVVQNRGRIRSRLRAAAGQHDRRALLEQIVRLPALDARTSAGVARFAWSWAWRQMEVDFTFQPDRSGGRACAVEGLLPAFDAEEAAAARTWVLLVVLRGRRAHLLRWAAEGTTGDRDTTWGRLLSDDLPPRLRDPQERGERATYLRLRAWLLEHVEGTLAGLEGVLVALARLRPGRSLPRDVECLLRPGWHPEVPFPRSGFPSLVARAREGRS